MDPKAFLQEFLHNENRLWDDQTLKRCQSLLKVKPQKLNFILQNEKDSDGNTIVHAAIQELSESDKKCICKEIVTSVLKTFEEYEKETVALLKAKNDEGKTPIILAVEREQSNSWKDLLNFVSAKNAVNILKIADDDGFTALHFALSSGKIEMIRDIKNYFDEQPNEWYNLLKSKDQSDCTVFHLAAEKGNSSAIKFMMDNLSEDQKMDILGIQSKPQKETAIHRAVKKPECISSLMACITETENKFELLCIPNATDETVLHVSISKASQNSTKTVLKSIVPHRRAEYLALKSSGSTALHLAVREKGQLVDLLLENLNELELLKLLNEEDDEHNMPVDIASKLSGNEQVLERLQYHREKAESGDQPEKKAVPKWKYKLLKEKCSKMEIQMELKLRQLERDKERLQCKNQQQAAEIQNLSQRLEDKERLQRENQQQAAEIQNLYQRLEEYRIRTVDMFHLDDSMSREEAGTIDAKVKSWSDFQVTGEKGATAADYDASCDESSSSDDDVNALYAEYSEPAVPSPVTDKINELCHQYGVKDHLILQDPSDPNKFEIFGHGTTKIDVAVLDNINKEWEYNVTVLERREDGYAITKQCWDHPILDKYSMVEDQKWICEFIVQARRGNQMVAYAVGPAHMLFDPNLNGFLQRTYTVIDFRYNLAEIPPGERYAIRFDEGRDEYGSRITMSHVQEVPIFGYRYHREKEEAAVEDPLSPCRFLNDVVLFCIDQGMAQQTTQRLQHWRGNSIQPLIDINDVNTLSSYMRATNGIRIKVKTHKGRLFPNCLSVEQHRTDGKAYSLLFRLDDDEKQVNNINRDATRPHNPNDENQIQLALTRGDSGSIVYVRQKIGQTKKFLPLGMFVGYADWEQYNYPRGVYQAIFLRQALDDIQADYCDLIGSRLQPL